MSFSAILAINYGDYQFFRNFDHIKLNLQNHKNYITR